MRAELIRLGVALLATTAVVAAAEAQTTQCVNDAPNPYHMVSGWAGSTGAPIWELSPDGKVMKNFGSGYVFPHAVVPDKDGNIWIVDGQAKDGKGNQVMKLSPDGK